MTRDFPIPLLAILFIYEVACGVYHFIETLFQTFASKAFFNTIVTKTFSSSSDSEQTTNTTATATDIYSNPNYISVMEGFKNLFRSSKSVATEVRSTYEQAEEAMFEE